MSGFFTALHTHCDTGQAEAQQSQGARLRDFGCTNGNNHVVMVIIANVAIVQADDEVILFNKEQVEVCARVRLGDVIELTAIICVVLYFNTGSVNEFEIQQCCQASVEDGTERIVGSAVGIEYQSVTQ